MSEPPLKLMVRNRLLGIFPDCSPSTALEVPIISTSYASREDTTSARRTEEANENDASKHVETSSTNTCADHPLLLQKQKYLISSGTRRKKTISRNLKLNVRSGTDCQEPLPGCLPSVALEYSSSTVDGSRISSANISKQLIWCWLFTLKLPNTDEWLKSDALKDHLKAKENPPTQFKNKPVESQQLEETKKSSNQFKNKLVESQQLEETRKSSEPVQDQSCDKSTSATKYVPIHPLPKRKIVYHMKLIMVQFQPSRSSLNGF
ncbi:hypothetical protein ACFX13_023392 [Malus domestica]